MAEEEQPNVEEVVNEEEEGLKGEEALQGEAVYQEDEIVDPEQIAYLKEYAALRANIAAQNQICQKLLDEINSSDEVGIDLLNNQDKEVKKLQSLIIDAIYMQHNAPFRRVWSTISLATTAKEYKETVFKEGPVVLDNVREMVKPGSSLIEQCIEEEKKRQGFAKEDTEEKTRPVNELENEDLEKYLKGLEGKEAIDDDECKWSDDETAKKDSCAEFFANEEKKKKYCCEFEKKEKEKYRKQMEKSISSSGNTDKKYQEKVCQLVNKIKCLEQQLCKIQKENRKILCNAAQGDSRPEDNTTKNMAQGCLQPRCDIADIERLIEILNEKKEKMCRCTCPEMQQSPMFQCKMREIENQIDMLKKKKMCMEQKLKQNEANVCSAKQSNKNCGQAKTTKDQTKCVKEDQDSFEEMRKQQQEIKCILRKQNCDMIKSAEAYSKAQDIIEQQRTMIWNLMERNQRTAESMSKSIKKIKCKFEKKFEELSKTITETQEGTKSSKKSKAGADGKKSAPASKRPKKK